AVSVPACAWTSDVMLPSGSAVRVSFFFSSRRRHTRLVSDWSSDVCSSDLDDGGLLFAGSSTGEVLAWRASADAPAGRLKIGTGEVGRASCRERGEISGGGGALKKKKESGAARQREDAGEEIGQRIEGAIGR